MKYEILPDGNLKLSITPEEQKELQEVLDEAPDDFDSDNYMYDMMEDLIGNSELNWVFPEDIGALTDAPILGTHKDNTEVVDQAWGWMNYCIISLQRELLEKGYAILQKGDD